uniref:t-SNARE coiled-coil homology domain-containing protein n=1 Tax=Meloidogyne enterolobii TaxID=390850 RepID=A0A6V7X257_MELEN|nr:unnamed protein product [Meloidogyne enterolobii]
MNLEKNENRNSSDNNTAEINQIINNIQSLNQLAQQLNQCVEKIGGPCNDEKNQNSFSQILIKSNELSHNINQMFQKLNENNNCNRQQKLQTDRLMDHFVGILNQLQAAKRKAATYEKSKIKDVSDQQINEEIMDFKLRQQIQQQQQNNLEEIRERQETLSSLEKDIGDINQILTDLSQMVYNQNEVVETIESNIEVAAVEMQQGNLQIAQASEYQIKSRKKKLILSIFCFLILCIFLIIFWILIKK